VSGINSLRGPNVSGEVRKSLGVVTKGLRITAGNNTHKCSGLGREIEVSPTEIKMAASEGGRGSWGKKAGKKEGVGHITVNSH